MFCLNLCKLLFFCGLIHFGYSANILGIFPMPSKSHDILGSTLFKHLATIGHNVTYISPFSHPSQKNFYPIYIEGLKNFRQDNMKKIIQGNGTIFDLLLQTAKMQESTDLIFENPFVQHLINSKPDTKFDLLIHFCGIDGTVGFADHFKVPLIIFTPLGGFPPINRRTGNPTPLSYVPITLLPFTDDMNFFERTINSVVTLLFPLQELVFNWYANKSIRKYLPGSSSVEDIVNRVDLVLVNSHISTESPRPYVPNMIQIGGFHLHKPKPLEGDLKRVLDDAKEGFIYFSFGTNVNVKELDDGILNVFKKTLGKLPYKVIIKYEEDFMKDKPDNFHLGKWFPQPSVLAHPNAKLFITHGGYGGCTESLYYGVPMVCIPFFGDQSKNCADAEQNGYSITVKLNELTEETFSNALNRVLFDEDFKKAIKFKSEMYRNQPMNPMDKAVYWIEHVIKYKGAKHLKVKGIELPWYQYYLIDVFLFIGIIIFSIFSINFYLCRLLLKKLFGTKNKVKIN